MEITQCCQVPIFFQGSTLDAMEPPLGVPLGIARLERGSLALLSCVGGACRLDSLPRVPEITCRDSLRRVGAYLPLLEDAWWRKLRPSVLRLEAYQSVAFS